MKFGVITFPGSNCDHDVKYALSHVLRQDVVDLWHKDTDLQDCQAIILPGGFSYGDYLRSGAIARLSPIMQSVCEFAERGGFVLGICNGFQILCESGLLPGALLHNEQQKFICQNQYIRVETTLSQLTQGCTENEVLKIPIAHGEGRYFVDEATLKKLKAKGQILFRYCDAEGQVTDASNPNGSIDHIAGICNAKRNVFGMMPHPERCSDSELRNIDGKRLFHSLMQMPETL